MSDRITVDDAEISVWPEGQQLVCEALEQTLFSTRFPDIERYHGRLIDTIMRRAENPEAKRRYAQGGIKIYTVSSWDCPAARLVDERAKACFMRVCKSPTAAVDNSWANVYRAGDYIMAHSHLRALASLVYILDPGDPVPEDSLDGKLAFIDPRFGACCRIEKGRMTNPLIPRAEAGSFYVFPGQLLHSVNPYTGTRPRITLSWNINREPLPGSRLGEIEGMLAKSRQRTA